jgi:hypothetical protein
MSAIPQANTPNPHTNLLNAYMPIANKMGLQPKKKSSSLITEKSYVDIVRITEDEKINEFNLECLKLQ